MSTESPTIPVVRETIQSHSEPPQADSSLYFHKAERTRPDGVRQAVIAGVHVVFKAGHANKLHDTFNVSRSEALNPDVLPPRRALLVACDTLEISGTLSMPEWDVEIYARRLVFRDQGNINTTPLTWSKSKAAPADPVNRKAGVNGAEGRHAGSIAVFADVVDEPAHESMMRFVARGGQGQHGGEGLKGNAGTSMPSISNVFKYNDSGHLNTFTATYANPCVYARYYWKWGFIPQFNGKRGSESWPTNGQDALEPGAPGSGGNGGAWLSNQKALAGRADTTAGQPGVTTPGVRGGTHGTPQTSTHYEFHIAFDLIKAVASADSKLMETRTTKDGKSYDAKKSANGAGKSPVKQTVEAPNAWVHPLQLECVLRYARDAFLANARQDLTQLLTPYERALAGPLPAVAGATLPWVSGEAARWTAAQAEVATLLQRLRNQLDYFGNPAGYMPLLSLQASMRLYDLETKDALRMLMLSAWVQEKSDQAQSAANAFEAAIDSTDKDTASVAEQLVQAEGRMTALDQQMTSMQTRLTGLSQDLEKLRVELFNEASADLHQKAAIKFGVKMAAAICQVIPVGQPVLGTLGKIANIAADIADEGTPDTVSKIGETISKAREAAKKAGKAKEEAKKKDKDAADAPAAKNKASAWEKAGDGLGPALSMAGEAIGALQVSEEEIEVELARLVAASPKWKSITESIRSLNKDKSRVFRELNAVLLAIGDGYARLASNAADVATMHQERSQTLGKLSVEANQVVARMGQQARLSLQRTLYLLVKSYETTVLKPIDVDWSLDSVLDTITTLMKPEKGYSAARLNELLPQLTQPFEDNIRRIKKSLLDDYGFADSDSAPLEFGFTAAESPRRLEDLRAGSRLMLDPIVLGLILPGRERARALGFFCKALTFSADEPLPTSGNAIVTLRTDHDGTGRRDEHLYAVRGDAPRLWTWTYHFSTHKVEQSVPSVAALDLLNLLLADSSDTIKQRLAAPPAWSGVTIELEFSPPLPPARRPRLTSLLFDCTVESHAAPDAQCVLDIRGAAPAAPTVMTPADLAGRSAGFGSAYRIYGKAARVTLTAPAQMGDRPFSHWEILDGKTLTRVEKPNTDIVLDAHTWAYCRYAPETSETSLLADRFSGRDQQAIAAEVRDPAQAAAAVTVIARAPQRVKAVPLSTGRVLRAAARADAPVIGLVEEGDRPAVLAEAGEGWSKVAYQGLIGYVERR
jgi:hypothetical protein